MPGRGERALRSRSVRGPDRPPIGDESTKTTWTFLTNHLHVLLCIARDPSIRLRDVAALVGITERAAQSIVADLVDTGYLTRRREGRRNHYEVHGGLPLRHPLERHQSVSTLLDLLAAPGGNGRVVRGGASPTARR